MAPEDRLLAEAEGWSRTTAEPDAPVVARLQIVTESGAASFMKLSEVQADLLADLLSGHGNGGGYVDC